MNRNENEAESFAGNFMAFGEEALFFEVPFSITAKDFSHGVLLDGKGTIRRSRRAPVRGRSAASARPAARAPRATMPPRRRAEEAHSELLRRSCAENEADTPQLARLLRARRERPRGRAAEQRDELAPFHIRGHSTTSSARTSSEVGIVIPRAFAAF